MSEPSVGLVEIQLETPTIITRKIGKGGFYSSSHLIPGSTLLGALARTAILENVRAERGRCAKLRSPNDLPHCDGCPTVQECAYTSLWVKGHVQVSDGLPSPPDSKPTLGESPVLIDLQSIFEAKRSRRLVDGLIFTALQRMAVKNLIPKAILLENLTLDSENVKKKPKSVKVTVKEGGIILEKWRPESHVETHVSINPRFRASKKGILYSLRVLEERERFNATVIGDQNLLKEWFNGRRLSIGAARSRGYGRAKIRLLEHTPISSYIEKRSQAISDGFKAISQHIKHKHGLSGEWQLGTITGLSPLPLFQEGKALSPAKALAERLGLNPSQLIVILYRRVIRPRWDRSAFIFTPAMNTGYCAVFRFRNDPGTLAKKLANAEIRWKSMIPGYGWLIINHPIHHQPLIMTPKG